MRLAGIDLNLMTALDALLEERSVTRAASRLGLTQPAVSHALRRLRELLGDELLVRTSQGMRPTPRANELRPAVRAALEAAAVVLQAAPRFEPRSAARTFRIASADQATFQLIPALIARLSEIAPGIRIDITPTTPERISAALAEDLDLALGVFADQPTGMRSEVLFEEPFVCVVRKGSAAARGRFDLDRYLTLAHVLVAPRGLPGSPLDELLARRGHRRTIALTLPQFLVAPHVVATTDLCWTAPAALARAFARHLPLVLRAPPFELPGFELAMRWSVRLDRDPGHAWLRDQLHAVSPRGAR
ncbi:MAG: LysR family transcriptional regulator [Kofleriaceae bacterium]